MIAVCFALLGAFSQALASVLHRMTNAAGEEEKRSLAQTIGHLIRQPRWLLGMVAMGGTFVFTALALYFGTLATVQPILVTELIFTLALRAFWLHDTIPGRTWGAAGILCAGLFGFLMVARPQEGHGSPSPTAWVVALTTRGVAIVVLVLLSRWGSPARKAALLGAAAGMMWAIDAAFVKSATDALAADGWIGMFAHWSIYAVVVSGVAGTFLLEAAFAAGPLSASQSTLLIVDPLASIAMGVELFGEQLASSPVAITFQVVFLLVMFTGVVLLSRWAPPVMEAHVKRSPRTVPVGEPSPPGAGPLDGGALPTDPAT